MGYDERAGSVKPPAPPPDKDIRALARLFVPGYRGSIVKGDVRFQVIEHGSPDYRAAIRLRDEILKNPEGRNTTPADVQAERAWTHVAGYLDGELRATCLLVDEPGKVRMKRVAVATSVQGQGIGTGLLAFCEEYARAKDADEIYAHARENAVRFYERAGYTSEGDYFDEVGIPHMLVRKQL
ncbi:MAG: GNAT family N-acetyltransferase [Myxococcota bacterium]